MKHINSSRGAALGPCTPTQTEIQGELPLAEKIWQRSYERRKQFENEPDYKFLYENLKSQFEDLSNFVHAFVDVISDENKKIHEKMAREENW